MDFTSTPPERKIVITRLLNAPRELVFAAFTEPQHMGAWWGPHHFSAPQVDLDPRPGGKWRIVMRSPEGEEFPVGGTYKIVDSPNRLVYSADHLDEFPEGVKPPPTAIHDLTFEDRDGKTWMTAVFHFETIADREEMIGYQFEAGWTQGIDKLETHVATLHADSKN